MPDKATIARAKRDKKEGKSPSTQAGEFVHKEIDKIRAGKHGARNTRQAIAIGLSEARRAGVKLPPPKKGTTSEKPRANAKRELEKGQRHGPVNKTRSQASKKALKKESTTAASHKALSQQARSAAGKRSAAAKKAARTRASHR